VRKKVVGRGGRGNEERGKGGKESGEEGIRYKGWVKEGRGRTRGRDGE
jgi:hypothetical protein